MFWAKRLNIFLWYSKDIVKEGKRNNIKHNKYLNHSCVFGVDVVIKNIN